MSPAADVASSQRVPAWKRLGLKLKGTASDESPAPAVAPAARNSAQQTAHSATGANGWKKRKDDSFDAPNGSDSSPYKKARLNTFNPNDTPLRRRKSVTFTDDTKPAANVQVKKSPKKKKTREAPSSTTAIPNTPNLQPSLNYLSQWKVERETWKFNKNHQTLLIKYVFTGNALPSSDIETFYEYIRDLKGGVRSRLSEVARELKKEDMAGQGVDYTSGKGQAELDKMEAEYQKIVAEILPQQSGDTTNVNGKRARRISEVDYVLRTADVDLQRRLMKRIRAENVLDELSDGEQSSTSGTTDTPSGSSAQNAADADMDKRMKMNDGSQQRVKRKRVRKDRSGLGDADESSSSESSSDSDSEGETDSVSVSESSSSGSDTESSEDVEMPLAAGQVELDTSSSSSSSDDGGEYESHSDSDDSVEED